MGIGFGGYALAHVLARGGFTALYATAGAITAGGGLGYMLAAALLRGRRPGDSRR